MTVRPQRTLARPVVVEGFGLFGGADVRLTLHPADIHTGLVFQRVDLPGKPVIPADIRYLLPQPRRTVLQRGEARVEMVEHVLAALAGMWIDNCLILLDAVEPPVGDGSALEFVEAILYSGIEAQDAPARVVPVLNELTIESKEERGSVFARRSEQWSIRYDLDYGNMAIQPQSFSAVITPEEFVREIAFARTFVLESEIAILKARGYGQRATTKNLLVFGADGVIDNQLRADDECARHKLLDCVGDLALCGGQPAGSFHAVQSGHRQNHLVVEQMLHTIQRRRWSA